MQIDVINGLKYHWDSDCQLVHLSFRQPAIYEMSWKLCRHQNAYIEMLLTE